MAWGLEAPVKSPSTYEKEDEKMRGGGGERGGGGRGTFPIITSPRPCPCQSVKACKGGVRRFSHDII
jgi:hypothetical protein